MAVDHCLVAWLDSETVDLDLGSVMKDSRVYSESRAYRDWVLR